MRFELRCRVRSALMMGLQLLGLLGTSHGLDFLLRQAPGYATSRAARVFEFGDGSQAESLAIVLFRDVIGTATMEELLFRGILFEGLRRMLGVHAAIVGSAACFGLAHLDLHQGLAATLLGLQLGALRAYFGLPLAIAAHVSNNAAALLAALLVVETGAIGLALAVLLSGMACADLVRRSVGSDRCPGVGGSGSGNERSPLQRDRRLDE